jgi:23S rRNA pseudouridine955/2504/2580 synthase/23S rRNA pseudouridine1911/1915/1917 synthase
VKTSLNIIKETDQFVAINKPAGLLSIPDREGKDSSLKKMLQDVYGEIFTVHRLDRDTSGIIVFAKTADAHQFLSKSFEERTVEKYYVGLVNGMLTTKKGTVEVTMMQHPGKMGVMIVDRKGKVSITDYEVVEEFGKYSLLQFRIHTGRTHQIRLHMQYLGHSIVCDETYGDGQPIMVSSIRRKFKLSKSEDEERPIMARLGLHSQRLKFQDAGGETHDLEAEMPKDMRALLQQLRKAK